MVRRTSYVSDAITIEQFELALVGEQHTTIVGRGSVTMTARERNSGVPILDSHERLIGGTPPIQANSTEMTGDDLSADVSVAMSTTAKVGSALE